MVVRGPALSHTVAMRCSARTAWSRRTKRAQLTLRRLDITQLLSMNQPSGGVGGFWFCGCNCAEKLTFVMVTFFPPIKAVSFGTPISNKLGWMVLLMLLIVLVFWLAFCLKGWWWGILKVYFFTLQKQNIKNQNSLGLLKYNTIDFKKMIWKVKLNCYLWINHPAKCVCLCRL